MILQALTSLYEALAPKGEVPKEGWSREKISFALGIDENGDLLRITPLFKPGDMPKGKKEGRTAGDDRSGGCEKNVRRGGEFPLG